MTEVKNIMTVDLEDYFCDLEFSQWGCYESRIKITTGMLLDLFKKYGITATFFSLGYIAEKFPDLIHDIQRDGHEIASHGYSHLDIRKCTRDQFEEDLVKSFHFLEKASGQKILGFRAPFFSIDEKTFWALDVLRKYVKYDSSIFPVKTPLYGVPQAPRNMYRPSQSDPIKNDDSGNLIELPPATMKIPFVGNIPIAGGFHLRFLPYAIVKSGIKKINDKGLPAMCYIHPKDLDADMPKIPRYSWHYYYGLKNSKRKFEKLLADFKFESVRNVVNM